MTYCVMLRLGVELESLKGGWGRCEGLEPPPCPECRHVPQHEHSLKQHDHPLAHHDHPKKNDDSGVKRALLSMLFHGQQSDASVTADDKRGLGCVQFANKSHAATKNGALDEIVSNWKAKPGPILVLGSADCCGEPTFNVNLSWRRAQALADQLLSRVPGDASSAITYLGVGAAAAVPGGNSCDLQPKQCELEQHRVACVFPIGVSNGEA